MGPAAAERSGEVCQLLAAMDDPLPDAAVAEVRAMLWKAARAHGPKLDGKPIDSKPEADAEAESLGIGDTGLADGDCDVDGF